jgi:hypothetical protein
MTEELGFDSLLELKIFLVTCPGQLWDPPNFLSNGFREPLPDRIATGQ